MGSFDALDHLAVELHHHDSSSAGARAFLLRSAARSSAAAGGDPLAWTLDLFELDDDDGLKGAWSGGWGEGKKDVDDLVDLMPDKTAEAFAKRLGAQIAAGGAYLAGLATASASVKLKIKDDKLREFTVTLEPMPKKDWLKGVTALAADAVKSLAHQRPPLPHRASDASATSLAPLPDTSSQLSVPAASQGASQVSPNGVGQQQLRALQAELERQRELTAKAQRMAASQSPAKAAQYVDLNPGRPKGMSLANPNQKAPRRTEGDGFDSMSDDDDGDDAVAGNADGDGSVTDPGSAAGATPSPRQKGKGKAKHAPAESSGAEEGGRKDGSQTEETGSEGEATLRSPLKGRGKGKSPASKRGLSSSPAKPPAGEPPSFALTLSRRKRHLPGSRAAVFGSDSSDADGARSSEDAKPAPKKSKTTTSTAAAKRGERKASASKSADDDGDASHTESD